ncbi:MAG: restriction endonuclease subunit S [Candidatus Accumulibacter sp.]|nr:restriction endonuclease subunit S [Accumulibacter sp.]
MNFDAPSGFLLTDCQNYCLRVADGTHETPTPTETGKKLATSKNIKDGRLTLENFYRISDVEFEEINKRSKVDQWDILISMIGTVGEVCLINDPEPDFAIKNVGLLKCGDQIRGKWLYYFLRSPLAKSLIEARKKGTTQQYISLGEIRRFPVIFPENQEHMVDVVNFLSSLDDRITLLRETNATLEAIAQALFKSWFVDFDPVRAKMEGRAPDSMDEATAALFPDSFEESELGLVPKGWCWKSLEDAYWINPPRKLKKGEPAPYIDMSSAPTQGHSPDAPVLREHGSGSKFQNGDTLLARITPCLENGKSVFVDCLDDGQIAWGSTEFIVLKPKPPLPDYHAYLLCRHPAFREYAIQSMSGTSGRQRVQNDVLGRFMIALPEAAIVEAFGAQVQAIQQKISSNHQQAQTLAPLRDTLLPRLISGQLRLPEAA